MLAYFISQLNSIYLTKGQIFLAFALFILGVGLIFIGYCMCDTHLNKKNKKGHFLIKGLMIALSPTLLELLSLFRLNLPLRIYDIIFLACVLFVLIWNIISMGILHGVIYTLLNIAIGALISITFIIAIAVLILVLVLNIGSGGSSQKNADFSNETGMASGMRAGFPSYLENLRTNERCYVTEINGKLYINNNTYIYPNRDYPGRYFDSSGNEYIER